MFRRGGSCLDCWGRDEAAQGESRLLPHLPEWHWPLGYCRLEMLNVTQNMKLSLSVKDKYWKWCFHLPGLGTSYFVWRVGVVWLVIPSPWPSLCLSLRGLTLWRGFSHAVVSKKHLILHALVSITCQDVSSPLGRAADHTFAILYLSFPYQPGLQLNILISISLSLKDGHNRSTQGILKEKLHLPLEPCCCTLWGLESPTCFPDQPVSEARPWAQVRYLRLAPPPGFHSCGKRSLPPGTGTSQA